MAMKYFELAAVTALQSTCQRSKCGAIIVSKTNLILGTGFNSPPGPPAGWCGSPKQGLCRCTCDKSLYHPKVTDKTCCMHAEQRAILNALVRGLDLHGSTLYFARLDENNQLKPSGNPYCTICSKMALDCEVGFFALLHKKGPKIYTTFEYNNLSYDYGHKT